jgi:two-component system sensor histidine kinase BaeS
MRLTLFKKILMSMLFISTLMVLGMAWLINYSFQSGLQSYLDQGDEERLQLVAETIAPYYSLQYGWSRLDIDDWYSTLEYAFARPTKGAEKQSPNSHASYNERLFKRIDLVDQHSKYIFKNRNLRLDSDLIKIPILYQENTIGWIVSKRRSSMSGDLERRFYEQQQHNFMWIVLWVALLSSALAWLLVRHLLTPLKQLEQAADSIQQGDYSTQIEVSGEDELAALSTRFNELSCSLLQQKETREQWLADISHELRTPISVLKSEIEALQDGIRQAEPKYIDSLHHQVQNLSQLVNDLYQLSLSDAGMQFDLSAQVDVEQVISTSCAQYHLRCQEKQIKLTTLFEPKNNYFIKGDKKSLTQLFSNLLENSLRYTDAPGELLVQLKRNGTQIQISIEDSAPGVPSDSLSKLFDRLYRVDESRSRLSGGAGLGLSICQTIVKAHHGEMIATHSKLGGLAITINLPLITI